MSEELKPCPFCQGEASRQDLTDADNAGGSCIVCDRCGASSPVHFDRKENLYDSWNRRASPTPPTTEGREEREKSAKQFDFYAREHAVKADRALSAGKYDEARASAAKAKANAEFAAMCKAALLSSPRVEAIRREALEEAAKVAERGCLTHPDGGSPTEPERELCAAIARDIRALTAKETER